MVLAGACRKDKLTAKNTMKIFRLEMVSNFQQARVIFLGLAVLIGEQKSLTVAHRAIKLCVVRNWQYAAGLILPIGLNFYCLSKD